LILLPVILIILLLAPSGHAMPPTVQPNHAGTPREALAAFKKGHFDQVIRQLETLPPDQDPPRELLKIGVTSYLKLGRPETAFKS
jgi:hypothetical protein